MAPAAHFAFRPSCIMAAAYIFLISVIVGGWCYHYALVRCSCNLLRGYSQSCNSWLNKAKSVRFRIDNGHMYVDIYIGGACGYDNTVHAGFGLNTAAVSAVLFRGGQACGACYQVKCNMKTDPKWCVKGGVVTVTATNFCPPNNMGGWCDSPRSHFDMSMPAFFEIAKQGNEGIIPILYRRIGCKRNGGVRFTLKGQSNFNMVMISNVGGSGDIRAAWIKVSTRTTAHWVPMHRNWGANWQTSIDLRRRNLSFKLALVDGKTREFGKVVPSTWDFGQTYVSSAQFS